MAIEDLDTPYSDGWWLKRLSKALYDKPKRPPTKISDDRRCEYNRSEWLDMLWARFTGNGPLQRIADRYVDATRDFMRLSKTNFGALVVEALQDRTQFLGVRSAEGADADGDDTVRAFLTENGPFMDDALTYAYALGTGYVMVGPPAEGEKLAIATAEDPRQVIVATDPARPSIIRAGLKMYRDDDANEHIAALYLPGDPKAAGDDPGSKDRYRTAVRKGASWSGLAFSPKSWDWDADRSGPLSVQGLGVPIVPVVNKLGTGEFENHLDLLDRIQNGIADRLWTAKFQTFLQRALIGDLPTRDAAGNEIDYNDIFSADPGALWRMPAGSSVWESKQVNLDGLLAPVRDDIKEFSGATRTPLFMFSPDSMTGSAEGASLARESLTFKAEDRIRRFSPAAVRISRLGLAYSGKAAAGELQAMWAPVERYSLEQRGAAAVQAKTSGVPQRSVLSDIWQFAPTTVARMERERRSDLLYADQSAQEAPARG